MTTAPSSIGHFAQIQVKVVDPERFPAGRRYAFHFCEIADSKSW